MSNDQCVFPFLPAFLRVKTLGVQYEVRRTNNLLFISGCAYSAGDLVEFGRSSQLEREGSLSEPGLSGSTFMPTTAVVLQVLLLATTVVDDDDDDDEDSMLLLVVLLLLLLLPSPPPLLPLPLAPTPPSD